MSPASYVLSGCEASFATVVAAAQQRGECTVGYPWTDRDEVVVIVLD
ncbi:hypothetical protein [Streptomyces sp. NPDC012510]